MAERDERLILVTGATGYVGGRLVRALEESGKRIRCLARRPHVLRTRVAPDTEVVAADLSRPETLPAALEGVHTAYYLVHSLGQTGDFESREQQMADTFGKAAKAAGVQRIIYLGGLCDPNEPLSPHLRSRMWAGAVLRASGVNTIELRASIIIGSGSLSFELIRALVRRLPVMITPRWVYVRAQPIAITDVISYLMEALDLPLEESEVFEVGGADQVSYGDLMRLYARLRGLRRLIIPVPVLTPKFSSLWLGLVTPIYARIGRRLIDSITTPSVVHDDSALRAFSVRPMGIEDAIRQALNKEDQEFVETHWADALSAGSPVRGWGGVVFRNRLVDTRVTHVPVPPEVAFRPIRRIGGRTGWYYANFLWHFRGFLDWVVGGVGMSRGRRDPDWLRVGDVLDCWRVEIFEPPRVLVLRAEMKMPGRAWLQFELEDEGHGTRIAQTALFDPVGAFGLLYWYTLWPAHEFVFQGLLRNIARAAMEEGRAEPDTPSSHNIVDTG